MYSKIQFYALEIMCRLRAAVARKEMEYRLNEAEEWTLVATIVASSPAFHARAGILLSCEIGSHFLALSERRA
jgi:hypothetical protein